ncbi:hypothetical protein EIN_300290 [Entamoeba invadens IP1]|uniref:Uncharacterized protein n=1 Tax=Entamoeba invadens IP1 TaxID=370355 RepID=A0A0A1U6L0_ENTIV|nr:hypothetical protein EIN_300290 [Entamoeba invadens IP1]ELP89950.1 hypothetical protein EIN_300290 [Entamoeba invadens IP1]|eukprot:XP_004256721.1 hypothetical protein EIN_300290 [Entamoeba invadens IP1]
MSCFDLIPNCQLCEYNNENKLCTKCYAPYIIDNDKFMCVLAYSNTTHFNSETLKSDVNNVVDGKCIFKQDESCFDYSLKTCDNCSKNVITTNVNCSIESICKYQLTQNDKTSCLIFKNDTQEGIKVNNCKYTQNEFCYLVNDGFYTTLNINGETISCDNAKICQVIDGDKIDISCKSEFVLKLNMLCSQDTNCVNNSGTVCTTCQQNHHIAKGGCVSNDNEYGKCVSTDSINCKEFVSGVCTQCDDDHYKDTTGCLPKQEKYPDCEYVSVVMSSCLECNKSYLLVDNSLKKTTDNCMLRSSKWCLRCSDGDYIMNSFCVRCEYSCTQCSNLTYCTKCDAYSYTKNGKCFEINKILSTCDVMMSTYEGCILCKDGYMR